MADQRLITNFEKELKNRVEMRTHQKLPPERVLLDAFKYYDIQKTEVVDFKTFKKVATVKLGISVFGDEEMFLIFEHYSKGNDGVVYREMISELYNINVVLSTRTQPESLNESRSFTKNRHDIVDEEASVKKMIVYLVYKLRKGPMFSFLKLYKDFREYDIENRGSVSLNELTHCMKKNEADISSKETKNLFMYFNDRGEGLEYEKLMDSFCVNFKGDRVEAAEGMFTKFDFMGSDKININMLKELFNPRQHYEVKLGKESVDKIQFQFDGLIDIFARIIGNQMICNSSQFMILMKMVSAKVESDLDFKSFVDYCFKYNEIPQQNQSTHGRSDRMSYKSKMTEDLPSMHSGLKVTNILDSLEEQLSRKGYKAFINFYKIVKGNDFNNEGHLYLKHFEKCLKEARIGLTPKQAKKIYDEFTDDNVRMNYEILFQNLVPPFRDERIDYLKDLYGRLMEEGKGKEKVLSFHTFHNSFFVRGHPDFKTRVKHDYELKDEFRSALETFLVCFQGNYMTVPPVAFIRFFEFYARNWSMNYFKSVLVYAFKTNKKSRYADGEVQNPAPFMKKINDKPTYQEENQRNIKKSTYSNVHTKTEKPYYVDESLVQNQKKPEPVRQEHVRQEPSRRLDRSRKESNRFKKSTKPMIMNERNVPKHLQTSFPNTNPDNVANIRNKLISNIRNVKDVKLMLEMEYEMTNQSDDDGNVGVTVFASVLSKYHALDGINENQLSILFRQHMEDNGQLHVQTFCNEIRGQMNEDREEATVDVFDRITPQEMDMLPIPIFRKAFYPQGYKFGNYKGTMEKLDMFDNVVDLFMCLNVSIKDENDLELDDFLYLFDNFSFHYDTLEEYKAFLKSSFK